MGLSVSVHGQTDVTWTGNGDGVSYTDLNNWTSINGPVVPIDGGGNTFRAIIPGGSGFAVNVTLPGGISDVTELELGSNLGSDVTLTFLPGGGLNVINPVTIVGTASSNSGGTVSLPNIVDTQAQLTVGGTVYSSVNQPNSVTIMSADGVGSILDASSITDIDTGFNTTSPLHTIHKITATNGGLVDLSGLQSISPPVRLVDFARVELTDANSEVRLSSLATINGTGGRTMFALTNNATLVLPSLQTVEDVHFFVFSGSQLTAAGAAPVAYSSIGFPFFTTLFWVEGPGSVLDLSAINSIDAGFNDGNGAHRTQTIAVENGGQLNLSGLTTINPPARAEDWLRFEITGPGAQISLGNLQTVNGVGGRTMFALANNVTLSLPSLQTAEDLLFDVSSGSQVILNGAALTYSSVGLPFSTTVIAADGATTALDLSAVSIFDARYDDGGATAGAHKVVATNGASINLANLQTILPPIRAEDFVEFNVIGSSAISLSALRTVGQVSFVLSGAAVQNLPALETATNVTFDVSGGSQLNLTTPTPVSYSSAGMSFNKALIRADGLATQLNLGPITTIDASFSNTPGISVHTITAANGAAIDLSGVQTINAPLDPSDRLEFVANSGGDINLSSLGTVASTGGQTHFVVNNATITVGAIQAASHAQFLLTAGGNASVVSLSNANNLRVELSGGSSLTVGSLQSVNDSAFVISEASTLSAGSLGVGNNVTFSVASGGALSATNIVLDSTTVVGTELNGTNPSSGFGRITSTGSITLAGELAVTVPVAFVPRYGDGFEVLTYTSRSGSFDRVTVNGGILSLRADLALAPVYDFPGIGDPLFANTPFAAAPNSLTLFATLPGDANLDLLVDDADLSLVLTSFGSVGATWINGDFTGDGLVDDADLSLLLTSFGQSAVFGQSLSAAQAVPQPTSLVLLLGAVAGLGACRSRMSCYCPV